MMNGLISMRLGDDHLPITSRTTTSKVELFQSFFTGLSHVYGTYDPVTKRSWQEKKPVTAETILAHLKGKRHYGVYLLVKDTIRAIAADFDHHDPTKPLEFIRDSQALSFTRLS